MYEGLRRKEKISTEYDQIEKFLKDYSIQLF